MFGASGYAWLISYTGGDGNDVTVTMQAPLTAIEEWRLQHFNTIGNTGNAADTVDLNGDGETNLMEFATAQDPNAATLAMPTLSRNAGTLEFNYKRASAAINDGVTFAVEWSVTLAPNSWSSAGVTEQVVTDNGVVQTVRAIVPSGMSRRFLHLKVYKQ